jgi:hypothetical protein
VGLSTRPDQKRPKKQQHSGLPKNRRFRPASHWTRRASTTVQPDSATLPRAQALMNCKVTKITKTHGNLRLRRRSACKSRLFWRIPSPPWNPAPWGSRRTTLKTPARAPIEAPARGPPFSVLHRQSDSFLLSQTCCKNSAFSEFEEESSHGLRENQTRALKIAPLPFSRPNNICLGKK